jgi:hypothetical protein
MKFDVRSDFMLNAGKAATFQTTCQLHLLILVIKPAWFTSEGLHYFEAVNK